MNINPDKIEEKITPNTKAIMAVHTMGKPCEMDRIKEISKEYDLKIIEDCCEAHGGEYKNNFVYKYHSLSKENHLLWEWSISTNLLLI